ncbi:hypothetical protein K438DRAFT_212204 [Mycena galopus ATCC 62051]|nr:hypothetical protein K438DRAFT_212204 [Mycena galopus ATCC 62051]
MLSMRPDDRLRLNMGAAKTPGRENATRAMLMTVQGKGSLLQGSVQPIPRTKSLHMLPATEKKPSTSQSHLKRPFGDKTPFPNRDAAPVFGENKLAKLVLENTKPSAPDGTTPASAPRPSSARTHLRAPRNSSGRHAPIEAPDFASLAAPSFSTAYPYPDNAHAFQTPAVNGRPWDVSPLAPSPIALPAVLPEEEDDYEEIEYMPPKLELEGQRWVPQFEMPDYGEVGRAMRMRAQGYHYDDELPMEGEIPTGAGTGDCWDEMPALALPELESDDPFASAIITSSTKPETTTSATARKTIAPGTRRPLTSIPASTRAGVATTATTGAGTARRAATSIVSRSTPVAIAATRTMGAVKSATRTTGATKPRP